MLGKYGLPYRNWQGVALRTTLLLLGLSAATTHFPQTCRSKGGTFYSYTQKNIFNRKGEIIGTEDTGYNNDKTLDSSSEGNNKGGSRYN